MLPKSTGRQAGSREQGGEWEWRDQAGTAPGWCSRGASLPAEHSWLCPGVQQQIQVSMVPIWFIHLQPRHSLGIPSNIPWLSWELREQGAREGWGGRGGRGGAHPQPRAQLGAKVQQCKKNLKTSSSSQLGVAAPGPGLAVPKGMAAGGSGKQELMPRGLMPRGLMPSAVPAHPHCCSFPLLPLGSRSSSLPVAPRLYSTVAAAIPFPRHVGVPQEASSPP